MPTVMGVAGLELLSDSDMRVFCRAVWVLAQVGDTGTLSGSWLLLVKRGACGGDLLWACWLGLTALSSSPDSELWDQRVLVSPHHCSAYSGGRHKS